MKSVLVTGAGSGLGMQTTLLLASEGYRVFATVLHSAEQTALSEAAAACKVTIESDLMDVTNEAGVFSTVNGIVARSGGIDCLIHFAGIGLRGFIEDLSSDEVRRAMNINFFGSFSVVQAMLPHMRKAKHGRIVLTTSMAGRMPSMSIGGYAATKFAIEGFAESLRQELRLFNVWVSILEPGLVDTPTFGANLNRAARAKDVSSPYYLWFCQHESIVRKILLRNKFNGNDVARVVLGILRARKPKLRYVVGSKAKVILFLRRYIPGELFQEAYWGVVRRMVTRPKHPVKSLSDVDVRR